MSTIKSSFSKLTAPNATPISTSLPTKNINKKDDNWRLWCRFCAKDEMHGNISIFFKDDQQQQHKEQQSTDLSLPKTIEKYFGFHIKRNDGLPQMLCSECFSWITSLVNFSERLSKAQNMYEGLHNSSLQGNHLDAYAVRMKYGLFEYEHEHLPEIDCIEIKPNITEMEENVPMVDESSFEQPCVTINIKNETELEGYHMHDIAASSKDMEDPYNGAHSNGYIAQLSVANVDIEPDYDNIDDEDDEDYNTEDDEENLSDNTIDTVDEEISLNSHRKRVKTKKNSLNKTEACDTYTVSHYICSECPKKFHLFQKFRLHARRVHGKKLVPTMKCKECPRAFHTQQQVERHAQIHLPVEFRTLLPCRICDEKFSTNSEKRQHMNAEHAKERTFICEVCGKGMQTSSGLKDHMLTHTDYAPFECKVCKKGFKTETRLKDHIEIHDPKKYTCTMCGKQLNTPHTLNRHMLVHSDAMQHKCDYCGREFKRAKALKTHLILHTGLKPYKCDFCERTFANGSNCRSHKKKAHPEELAALEAAGGGKNYTRNIPKLETLKAVTKAAENLNPVVTKQSGCFAFGKKPEPTANNRDHLK